VTKVARTPSSFSPVAAPQTLAELEFDRALAAVARHAVSDLGAAAVRARLPQADADAVGAELVTVAELATELDERGGFEPRAVPDIGEVLRALETPGSVLDGEQLRELWAALVAMREVAAQLWALADDAPRVAALAVEVPPQKLERAIDRAIEPDGRVKDDASPALKRARRRLRETRERLVADLEGMLRGLASHEAGRDADVTLKGGRYVIPVRREARSRVKGIVHGESSSGATLFVEPSEAVELGNALAQCEAEDARETLAVLRGLTDQARPDSGLIESGWEMCVAADDLYARARFALACEAHLPELEAPPAALAIRGGRHPLLVAESGSAVPFDLVLARDERTVMVSGPNAGGKTVLLKAVGLTSALAQAGVLPPVGAGTVLPVFRRIFSDIGDHQSIDASLSTFSAHVAALKAILIDADDGGLVLLDELGGGTDPVEGASLAGAVLLSLHGRRPVTIATTHLSQLKELAAATDGLVNASLDFDAENLTPTYRLRMGKPGRSYGLAIARRMGLPDPVLALADELTPEHARSVEATLAELERREAELARREAEVEEARVRLDTAEAVARRDGEELAGRLTALERREQETEREAREQARRFLLEARRRVEEALGVARAAVSEATAKEARRLVEQGVQEEADALAKLEEQAKKKGWKVKGGDAAPERSSERSPERSPERSSERSPERTIRRSSRPAPHAVVPELSSELDLRGKRADEAEGEVIAALDAAVVADLPFLRIIHGKGTGALRAVVHELLERDGRVARFELAAPHQGGTGVTIVEFRP
jgi:DNA mismatch repair protein MutS2